jgi:hypothetical protein
MLLTKSLYCYFLQTELKCGQMEASETIEKLKELPLDVYHELVQALLD